MKTKSVFEHQMAPTKWHFDYLSINKSETWIKFLLKYIGILKELRIGSADLMHWEI